MFILAVEALSRGLNSLHLNLYFCGYGLPKWSPKINHLSYADDTIIFSSSDATSLRLVMEVLHAYEMASGQLVNKGKSAIYMHHLVDIEVVKKVERITGIERQEFPFTYLGWPIFYARGRMDYYQGLITKIMDKLQSWKAVNPPNYVINKLHKIFSKFFWSSNVGGNTRHWASWNTLCMPYDERGIGFRSLHDVSKALFCKLCVEILLNEGRNCNGGTVFTPSHNQVLDCSSVAQNQTNNAGSTFMYCMGTVEEKEQSEIWGGSLS
ncbi:uncharacterized protein LOC142167931 [Nicotiana tabacum]|uniref:Uncharacterized protein LOC142167931 n=1 Tax=Nicotiana tabacum TaxID=4097 RepID=A0AC58SHW3_TOBAC